MFRVGPFLVLYIVGCGRLGFDSGRGDCSAFALPDAEVNLSTHLVLRATSPVEPVTFAVEGKGTMLGDSPIYISPAYRATTRITATDAAGCTATATVATGGRSLFYIGGTFNNLPSTEVWRSANALDWANVGVVPGPRVNGAATVFHDAVWYIGGSTDGGPTGQATVWRSTDGLAWASAPAFPVAVTDAVAIGFTTACG